MSRIVDAETFGKEREFARFHKHDLSAECLEEKFSWLDRFKFFFAPIQVGEVDFGAWPEDDPRFGTLRRLPLYLFSHSRHISVDYPHGFPGVDERLDCHCGHRHFFFTSRFPRIGRFITAAREVIEQMGVRT